LTRARPTIAKIIHMTNTSEVEKPDDHDVIYALRTAHQNQTQMNLMADQKANILVGAIVILMTFLFTRLAVMDFSNTYLVFVLTIIIILLGLALLFGIMVIKPRTKWVSVVKINEIPNPFFFGFFSQFKQQEYVDFMMGKLIDNQSARELLIQDIYQLGQVLKRKYSLLKYAYDCAAAGILLGLVAIVSLLIVK